MLRKIARELAPEGAFLFSIRKGANEQVEEGGGGGEYYIVMWDEQELHALLQPFGF